MNEALPVEEVGLEVGRRSTHNRRQRASSVFVGSRTPDMDKVVSGFVIAHNCYAIDPLSIEILLLSDDLLNVLDFRLYVSYFPPQRETSFL